MEKNPSFKIGRIFAKKKIMKSSRHFLLLKKNLLLWNFTHYFFWNKKIINLAVMWKTFFFGKNPSSTLKQKWKSPKVEGIFFETTSEAKCPEKPLANECRKHVHLATIPLPYHRGRNQVWTIMFQSKFI